MKLAECFRKLIKLIASRVVDLTAAPVHSGRRSSRSFATSAAYMVLATVVTVEMMTGVVMTIGVATIATIGTTIGGDEFHSLGTNSHLTSACNLLVYPARRPRRSNAGALFFPDNPVHPVILS